MSSGVVTGFTFPKPSQKTLILPPLSGDSEKTFTQMIREELRFFQE